MFEPFDFPQDDATLANDEVRAAVTTQLRQVEAAMEIDESLVLYGATTLLGLKCASMFNCAYTQRPPEEFVDFEPKVMYRSEFESELNALVSRLSPFGVSFDVVAWRTHSAMLLVYRPTLLAQALQDPLAKTRLTGLGYNPVDPAESISLLKERLREFDSLTRQRDFWDFPHEVGHFLGYAAEDVEAYTRSRARGYHCRSRRGAWFVYGDKAHMDECAKRFATLNAATTFAYAQHSEGTTLESLAAMGQIVEGSC